METHYYNPRSAAAAAAADGGGGGGASNDRRDGGDEAAGEEDNKVTRQKADNSGLKLYYTTNLRKHDAGVLSIGKFKLCVHAMIKFCLSLVVRAFSCFK